MKIDETSESGEKAASEGAEPFKALAAAVSLITALLYVAGFAFRWSYYFNFGVQHLVYNLSLHVILTTSMEMIKRPVNLAATLLIVGSSLVVVDLLITAAARVAGWRHPGKLRRSLAATARRLGARNPLVTDCLRAGVLIYVVYMLSSQMGYLQFRKHIVNSKENPLPMVTAIAEGDSQLPLACGKDWKGGNFIGDGRLAQEIEDYHRTCTLGSTVWRLLYRDEKSIYIFASESDATGKPLTIVLPNTDKVILVTE